MSKYLINQFSITPENFKRYNDDKRKVKALYIPYNFSDPKIIYDVPSNIKEQFFPDSSDIFLIPLHHSYHMYIDPLSQMHGGSINVVATYFLRYSALTLLGFNLSHVVSGNVLIFGSVSAFDDTSYDLDYSVPYEFIEQVSRVYDIKVTL
jgi:hypothetical protein